MIYILLLILLVALELGYFWVADRCNIIDKPNMRSSHSHVTLRGGGVIFPISVVVWGFTFGFTYPWFVLALFAISGISLIDDIRSVPNRVRILVQFGAMIAMFYQWEILNVDNWWMVIVALIFCTGIINAYNFMDGINGITGGYSLAVLIPLLLLNHEYHFIEESLLIVAIMSIIVFCFFNFRKRAKCFAGDVGAVGIAFIILFSLGLLILKTGNIFYIMFLSVYGVDTILTIIHRISLKENIFEAHRKHVYQLLANELKLPHVFVSSIYMLLQLVISLGLIYSPFSQLIYSIGVLCILIIGYILFKKKYYKLHVGYLKSINN